MDLPDDGQLRPLSKLPTVSGGSGPRFGKHTGRMACAELSGREGEALTPEDLEALQPEGSILLLRTVADSTVPETVLARLGTLGIQVIIAQGFEAHFHDLCVLQGVLPAILDDDTIGEIAAEILADPEAEATIDLEKQVIARPGREPIGLAVDARARNKLLLGLTDLEEALRYLPDGAALREADRKRRPWLYAKPSAPRADS